MIAFDVIQIYWPHYLLAAFVAGLLSVWGGYVAAQRKSVECLSVSQVAVLGSLVGIHFSLNSLAVTALSVVVAFLLVKSLESSSRVDTSALHFSAYVIFLTLCLILIQFSPALKAHFVPSFFGDIVLLSRSEILEAGLLTLSLSAISLLWRRQIIKASFQLSLLGRSLSTRFHLLRIFVIIFSIEYFGLLFTLAFLFIPTTFIQSKNDHSSKTHHIECIGLGVLSVLVGFPLMISLPHMQTTPGLVLTLALFSLGLRVGKVLYASKG